MSASTFFKRLVSGDNALGGTVASLRNVIVWVFIALVAAFLTQPAGAPASAFDAPVPWPAELGVDGNLGV